MLLLVDYDNLCTGTLENSFEVSLKNKRTLTVCLSSHTPGHSLKEMKTCPHRNLCTDLNSFICNSQKLETTKCPSIGK